jgi:hypothetical protein
MPQNYRELIDIYQAAKRACRGEQNGRGCTAT